MKWFGVAGRAFARVDSEILSADLTKKHGVGSLDTLIEKENAAFPGSVLERNGELLQFFGTARVGKDEMAKILREDFNYQPYSFAQPLKQAGQMLFGLTDRETWDDSIKEVVMPDWGFTPRKLFQLLGTEGGRMIYKPEMWGQLAARRWQDIREGNSIERPWLAPESHVLTNRPEDVRDFVLRQGARIMFDLGGSPWEWNEDTLVNRIKNETLPAILKGARGSDFDIEQYWTIRETRPIHAQVTIGPNATLKDIHGMSTPDVRFEDEGSIVRGEFKFSDRFLKPCEPGQVVVIHRILPDEFVAKMRENNTISHASERGIARNPADKEIWNVGTLEDFRAEIKDYIRSSEPTSMGISQ